MIARALIYYQGLSWWNRLRARIQRLRQPKYLFGAIVGGLYFYFYLFRGFGSAGHRAHSATTMPIPPEMNGLPETIAALAIMVVIVLAWILPHSRAALVFAEAEIAFLFPAPVSRKTLIHFKLLKSQTAILFSAILMTLIGRRWGNGLLLTRGLGWWVGMSIYNLHLLGSSFALTRLMDRGLSTWKRRALILVGVAAGATVIYSWVRESLPPFPQMTNQHSAAWLFHYLGQIFESVPLAYLLIPFRWVVAPYFAATYQQFLIALVPALCLLVLHYLWVVHSDVAFEEASVELSRRVAETITAARAGQGLRARRPKKAARPPFVLRPNGHPAVAVFWKNLISTGQYVNMRVWFMLIWIAIVCATVVSQASHGGGLGIAVSIFVAGLLVMSLFSGPQMLRNDLRQDLPVADVLKMLPMPGWQIVLGELLAPAAVLAGLQWLLLVIGVIFCPSQLGAAALPVATRWSVALAAAVVLPFVDLLALLIPNASALLFPAWFQLGKDTPRGFETMGQQLILMFGQLLVLLLGLLPAGIAFTLFVIGGSFVHWPLLGIVSGAPMAAIILGIEAGIGIKLLGVAFEKLDVSSENL